MDEQTNKTINCLTLHISFVPRTQNETCCKYRETLVVPLETETAAPSSKNLPVEVVL